MNSKTIFTLLLVGLVSLSSFAQTEKEDLPAKDFKFRAVAELGFLAVLDHKIQFSQNGTYFNYKREGGQNVLFPVGRLSLEFEFKKRNTFIFLYQPLRIQTTALLSRDLVVDGYTFPANSSVKFLYNFPFYRLSYLREVLPLGKRFEFAVGFTLQIRNATISFESLDGSGYRDNRDIGIVPALKFRTRAHLTKRMSVEIEADGIYAPVSYLNGSDNEVVGAILDASLRYNVQIAKPFRTFLNLRYLGGGAVGTSDDDPGPGDGYVRNWLHFMTVSAGFVYEW